MRRVRGEVPFEPKEGDSWLNLQMRQERSAKKGEKGIKAGIVEGAVATIDSPAVAAATHADVWLPIEAAKGTATNGGCS